MVHSNPLLGCDVDSDDSSDSDIQTIQPEYAPRNAFAVADDIFTVDGSTASPKHTQGALLTSKTLQAHRLSVMPPTESCRNHLYSATDPNMPIGTLDAQDDCIVGEIDVFESASVSGSEALSNASPKVASGTFNKTFRDIIPRSFLASMLAYGLESESGPGSPSNEIPRTGRERIQKVILSMIPRSFIENILEYGSESGSLPDASPRRGNEKIQKIFRDIIPKSFIEKILASEPLKRVPSSSTSRGASSDGNPSDGSTYVSIWQLELFGGVRFGNLVAILLCVFMISTSVMIGKMASSSGDSRIQLDGVAPPTPMTLRTRTPVSFALESKAPAVAPSPRNTVTPKPTALATAFPSPTPSSPGNDTTEPTNRNVREYPSSDDERSSRSPTSTEESQDKEEIPTTPHIPSTTHRPSIIYFDDKIPTSSTTTEPSMPTVSDEESTEPNGTPIIDSIMSLLQKLARFGGGWNTR